MGIIWSIAVVSFASRLLYNNVTSVVGEHKKRLNTTFGTRFHVLGAEISQETNSEHGQKHPQKVCMISKHEGGAVSTW